ncbi:hypothetical protein [Natrinema ejinorense]|uniref:Uncharacterized protein n=1 Tax=Natrinema ejinorense TaxID=373386 RepID=A0A2A5QY60_9EURY|nr:hypothetical protein [Natrinema ejinorense]PCR91757.1 hypothetical protein CP557_15235 [Natrinema ejinorense]
MGVTSRSDTGLLRRLFLSLSLTLACIHLYLAVFVSPMATGSVLQFGLIGVALLVGPVVSRTRYWHPILYLLGAGFAFYLGVLWLLGGMAYPLIGAITGVTATAFALLGLFLFVRTEARLASP